MQASSPAAPRTALRAVRLRSPLAGLALLTIAAFALRIAPVGVQSYWFDEAVTVHLLRMPFGAMLRALPHTELTPPLYYVVAWPWARLFGDGEAALRSLSAVLGAATVPAAYATARTLAGPRLAAATSALTAFSALLVWYSQEARPYALLVLLAALSLLTCLRAAAKPERGRIAVWALVAALALLTHYFAAFLVVPEGLWLAYRSRPRRAAPLALAAVAGIGAALIPLAVTEHRHISTAYLTSFPVTHRLAWVAGDLVAGFVIRFDTAPELAVTAVGAALALVGLALAATRTRGQERRAATLAAAAAVAALGIPCLLVALGGDYINTRNLLSGWLPALLIVASGYAATSTPRPIRALGVGGLCLVGLVAGAIFTFDPDHHRDDWRGAVRAIGHPTAARVIATPPVEGPLVLSVYLPHLTPLPPGGADITEVDVLAPRDPLFGTQRADSRPSVARPPAPAFRLVEQRWTETYVAIRYRSSRPAHLTLAEIRGAASGVTPLADAVVQRP